MTKIFFKKTCFQVLVFFSLFYTSVCTERIKRVIGGIPVNEEIFPASIYLLRDGRHICGGTRIHDFVLTAAHCVINTLPERLQLQQKGGEEDKIITLNILDIIIHQYIGSTNENDIALLYVGLTGIDYDENVGYFPLPITFPARNYKPGGVCFVSGPGIRNIFSTAEHDVGKLYAAVMSVVPHWRCRYALGYYLAPARNSGMFCAGSGARDACQGDSGSALLCLDPKHASWTLAGLVSYGMGCGVSGVPGVFTDVAYHRNWIDKQSRIARVKYRHIKRTMRYFRPNAK